MKREASHLLELRGRHQYSYQHSSRIRAPCVVSTAVGTKGKEGNMARSSASREQLMKGGREAGRSLMKRKKSTVLRTDSCNPKPCKHAYQKGKIESNEGGQPK